jgi:hypothetical protein
VVVRTLLGGFRNVASGVALPVRRYVQQQSARLLLAVRQYASGNRSSVFGGNGKTPPAMIKRW